MSESIPPESVQNHKGRSHQHDTGDLSRRAFLAYLRHELLTPLNAIIGYSEMLLEDAEAREGCEFVCDLQKVLDGGREMLVLVNDILDQEKINTSQTGQDLEEFRATLHYALRTPLSAVMGLSEMLLESAQDGDFQESVDDLGKIHSAANCFLAIIDDIVNFSKIRAGMMDPEVDARDALFMAQDAAESIRLLEEKSALVNADAGSLLVVDDNEMNRDLLSRYLKRQGQRVSVAENGRQALEIIQAHTPELVLLDIMMPEMNGYQVLQHLKNHETWKEIPVIMISALGEVHSVARCLEMGAEDYLSKPFDPVLLKARVGACLERKRLRDRETEHQRKLKQLNDALEVRNRFIRQTFGRYLSDEIVEGILETAEGLKLGGEKRTVTIMMTDLRGFTSISEQMDPEDVVSMINNHLETLTEILLKYQGTVNEIIGDAILVIFGAMIRRDDDAERAVACAVEMQLAMPAVNEWNRKRGYPEIAMGIGINTGEVVVGNIGSKKRTKYGVVGRNVNLTSRIESYTLGGQILISESTLVACGSILRIDDQMKITPKGVKDPITIYEIGGIGGDFDLYLPEKQEGELTILGGPIAIRFMIVAGKQVTESNYEGTIARIGARIAEIHADVVPDWLTNLKICLCDGEGNEIHADVYAKVTRTISASPSVFRIHFTSIPEEAATFLEKVLAMNARGLSCG